MKSPKILQRFFGRKPSSSLGEEFDPIFYLAHYEDLRPLRNSTRALKHYLKDGKREGRFGNEREYVEHAKQISETIFEDFDLEAYKFFNRDLAGRFHTRKDFLRHFVDHGAEEGRKFKFSDDALSASPLPDDQKWQVIFSASQCIAANKAAFQGMPNTRNNALNIFLSEGIKNLWPVNLDYAFDPDFYRFHYVKDDNGLENPEIYLLWLKTGFPSGEAPNERLYLSGYLGDWPYPKDFDWEKYRILNNVRNLSRSQVLIHLFSSSPKSIVKSRTLMGLDFVWLFPLVARHALRRGDFDKAEKLLDIAANTIKTLEILVLLGDARRQTGKIDGALDAYREACEIGPAPLEAYLGQIAIDVSRSNFEAAFACLREAHEKNAHRIEFRRTYENAINRFFECRSAEAHSLYNSDQGDRADFRAEADRILKDTLDRVRALFCEFDNLPTASGGNANGHVVILANDDLPQCKHYRVEQKVMQFAAAEIPVRVHSHHDTQSFMNDLVGARAAIFYRVGANPAVLRAILHADALGLETFYEIDDLLFDPTVYPDALETFESQISAREHAGLKFGVPLFRYAASMCRSGIASTPALATRLKALTITGRSVVLRNGLDARNEIACARVAAPSLSNVKPTRIFYGSGTMAHNLDFNELVAPALCDLLGRYPEIEVVIAGYLALPPVLETMRERIRLIPFVADIDQYWAVLATCDINLAVLRSGPVADCKSEIKWLEAAIFGIPSVVSATATLTDVITDGVDGFLAESARDWAMMLERLVSMPAMRSAMGGAARRKAYKEYGLQKSAAILKEIFVRPLPNPEMSAKCKTRILICNVFFHPQTIGGATRVVEANAKYFLDHCDDLEIALFCSYETDLPAGKIAIGSFGKAAVYRLSLDGAKDAAFPFNAENGDAFERVVDDFQPDIIHFHSIQRLSASIVETAARRGIPYVITLHDAWWISEYQFLVDADGMLRMPSEDFLGDCLAEQRIGLCVSRRCRLASLLRGAAARLTVSEAFASVYIGASISEIDVIENGTAKLEAQAPARRADGRVALGHIGGRSSHKGAFLIEAVLRATSFRNLHLTMIDGALAPGQSIETIWGTTPVTLVGPYPQAEVSQLYAQLNVLLAPSTWPESFGLVTREALARGLWVITSNLGAIGGDVEEGKNGFIIDVKYLDGMTAVLCEIDGNHSKYVQIVEKLWSPNRSEDDQARDLYCLYKKIACDRTRGLAVHLETDLS